MCGRFALGSGADDLADLLGSQYFRNQQRRGRDPIGDPAAEEDGAGAEGATDEEEPAQGDAAGPVASGSGSSSAPGAGTAGGSTDSSGGVRWDTTSKLTYRARYNVRWLSCPAGLCSLHAAGRSAEPSSRHHYSQEDPRTNHRAHGSHDTNLTYPHADVLAQKWGLIPSWTKRQPEKPLNTINCRSDTLASGKGMWSGLRNTKRCVVVAQGFVSLVV